jgi:hypothetical protein
VATQKYTIVAAKAVSLAELFAAHFEKGLDGPVHFRVELSAPDGPSTAGGKQALQHIKIIPDGGGMAVLIGSADTTRGVAEVRTYEHVAALYAQRFRGAPIPVDVTRYYELGQGLATFFRAMNMAVTFAELDGGVSAAPVRAAAQPSGGRAWMVLVGVGVGLVILAAAYVLIFLRR